jgi:hypothetical protein
MDKRLKRTSNNSKDTEALGPRPTSIFVQKNRSLFLSNLMNFDGEGRAVAQAEEEARLQVKSGLRLWTVVTVVIVIVVALALEAQNRHHLLQQKDQEGEHFG